MPSRRRRAVITACLAFAVLGLAAACGGGAKGGTLRIAVVPKGTMHEFWKAVHAGAVKAGAELGVQIEWKGPDPADDRQAQVELVQGFLSAGVQGLVLAPVDEKALVPVVAAAKAAGVPTVVIDSGLASQDKVSYVATDNKAGGVLAARHLGKLLQGKGKVVVLRFQQGSASTTLREAGCLETLQAEFPGIQVVSSDQYGGDTEKSLQAAESLLLAHPDIDGAFASNESTAHGMLLALQRTQRAGKVKFVGFDASKALQEGLRKAEVHGLVVQDPFRMGQRGVELMVQHLRGGTVPASEATALQLATPENLTEPAVRALLQPDLSGLGK